MITVTIFINGKPLFSRAARNMTTDKFGRTIYLVDDGTKLFHRRSDGAIPLAIQMLKTITEP